jgi:hypothetical protein
MWMHPDQLISHSQERVERLRAEAEQDRLAEAASEGSLASEPRTERAADEVRTTHWPTWLLAPLRLP